MIARNRPEVRLGEIVNAWFAIQSNASEPTCDEFAHAVMRALSLEGEPILLPSGRAALYFLFQALPLKRVYLPAYTCWAVLEAAQLAGKEVRFLDIDYPGLNVRLSEVERIRDHPGVVVATHQFGFPEDVEAVEQRLVGRGHVIIEDCAGAMFCRLRGAPMGMRGLAAVFSFETSKLWTLGRGGLIVTRDETLARRVRELLGSALIGRGRMILAHLALRRLLTAAPVYRTLLPLYLMLREPTEGMHKLSTVLTPDYLEAFSTPQARLGLMLVRRMTTVVQRRQELFTIYARAVGAIPGLTCVTPLPESLVTPIRYPVLVRGQDKRSVYDGMLAAGIDLGFSYSYSFGNPHEQPGAARFAKEVLNLPVYADIKPESAERIVAVLRRQFS